jgi:hypothetical protein
MTQKGKKNHRESENRRRQNREGQGSVKKMDDATSTLRIEWILLVMIFIHLLIFGKKTGYGKPRCSFCGIRGQVVAAFPGRAYGNNKIR